jgi:hypothetical protein
MPLHMGRADQCPLACPFISLLIPEAGAPSSIAPNACEGSAQRVLTTPEASCVHVALRRMWL